MILDLTAGNRQIWTEKKNPITVFLDLEPQLRIAPDIVADSRHLPFRDEVFNMVIFDPPHKVGSPPPFWTDRADTYYGGDKYRDMMELLSYIFKTVKEASRVLTPDGVLVLKWAESERSLDRVLSLFIGFKELLRIRDSVRIPKVKAGNTYWVLLRKR